MTFEEAKEYLRNLLGPEWELVNTIPARDNDTVSDFIYKNKNENTRHLVPLIGIRIDERFFDLNYELWTQKLSDALPLNKIR